MECVLSVSWWSLFHLSVERVCFTWSVNWRECFICQLMGWYTRQLMEWVSLDLSVDGVITCQLMESVSPVIDEMCFIWSVSWWSVSPDLSVDGVIYLSVDGVCFTWSVSWWSDLPVSWWSVFQHKVTCVLDCSLNSWFTFCLSVVTFLAALWNLWNSAW